MKLKLKLYHSALLAALLALPTLADEPQSPPVPAGPPDKVKISYAQGMNTALELKGGKIKVDPDAAEQAMKDVMENKPTELKDSEILGIIRRGHDAGLAPEAEAQTHKVSYAVGMRLAIQLKRSGAEIDSKEFGQGLRDVLDDKPTKIPQTEIPTLFRQAQAWSREQLAKKNQVDGATFLAKNAKAPGVTVLPSGLQYRVLKTGTGKAPGTNDLIFVKYRARLVDGHEFDHHNQFLIQTTGGIKGWQEALQRMHVGDKWELVIPSDIGFGQYGEPVKGVGPNATVIYDMELSEIVPPTDPRVGTGRVGHGMDGDHDSEPAGN